MLIHGKEDNLIPWSHSEELYDACNPDVPALLHMPNKMDHNEFNLEMDLIEPIKDFLCKIKFASRTPKPVPQQDDPVTENQDESGNGSEGDSSDPDNSDSSSGDNVIKRRPKPKTLA